MHQLKCLVVSYKIIPLGMQRVLAFPSVVKLPQILHWHYMYTMRLQLEYQIWFRINSTDCQWVTNDTTKMSEKALQRGYSKESTTPVALVKTRGNRQYPKTLAVRMKLTPVWDMRFNMKCSEIVPRRMNPYTYPKWLFPPFRLASLIRIELYK